jgi:hypothetical protein
MNHDRCPRAGLVATWPVFSESAPEGAMVAWVVCACPAAIRARKGHIRRMTGLPSTFYPDPPKETA